MHLTDVVLKLILLYNIILNVWKILYFDLYNTYYSTHILSKPHVGIQKNIILIFLICCIFLNSFSFRMSLSAYKCDNWFKLSDLKCIYMYPLKCLMLIYRNRKLHILYYKYVETSTIRCMRSEMNREDNTKIEFIICNIEDCWIKLAGIHEEDIREIKLSEWRKGINNAILLISDKSKR